MEARLLTFAFLISLICFSYCDTVGKSCPKPCHCIHSGALCVNKNLTYIPRFPVHIRKLTFTGNNITVLTSRTFENITQCPIERLVFVDNKARLIEKGSLKELQRLQHLDLSSNVFNWTSMFNLMGDVQRIKRINYLGLRNIGLENKIPTGLFQGLKNSNIQKLDLSENKLEHLNFTELKPLSTLKYLFVRSNKIASVTMDRLERILNVTLQGNHLQELPKFCDRKFASFPNLTLLNLSENRIQEYIPESMVCLQKMISLNLNLNWLGLLGPNSFAGLTSLKQLFLFKQQGRSFQISDYAFNHSGLAKIDLNSNALEIEKIGEYAFVGCERLNFLQLSTNHLSDHRKWGCERLNKILTPLKSIQRLMLSFGSLNTIPSVLSKMTTLQQVSLFNNKIESWSNGFWEKTQLKGLDVTYNRLETISEEMIGPSIQHRMKSFKIGHNPFKCDCELVWLIEWIREKPKVFSDRHHGYRCLNITKKICFENKSAFQSITVVCIILIVVFLLTSVVCKYKWSIKYQIYLWRHPRKIVREIANDYDVFVCYSAGDGDWIWDNLQPKMENEENLKLCLHERDFPGGKLIVDNIVDSMESSQRVLIILSNNFAKSSWCQFELTVAQNLFLDSYIDPPTIVLLEEIKTEYMSNTLNALIRNTTYVSWDNDVEVTAAFWHRLKRMLGRPMTQINNIS